MVNKMSNDIDFMNMQSNVKKSWNNGVPIDVTPEMASRWLGISKGKNPRTLKWVHVNKLANDLKSGNHTTRTIRFHKDGYLGDGQHLCNAIIQTGMTAKNIFVELGYSKEDLSHLDVGLNRSFKDTSKILGFDSTGSDSSLAMVIEFGLDKPKEILTHDQKRSLVEKHREEIDFVKSILVGAKTKPVATKKALVDAYNTIKKDQKKLDRLVRFGKVFSTSDISGGSQDQAAINLYRAVAKISTADRKTRHEVYRISMIAISNFMRKKTSKKLCMDSDQKEAMSGILPL